MTQTPLTSIQGLILEDYPYILPFEILEYSNDRKLFVKLPKNHFYYQQRISELVQAISTIGSYCVALQINNDDRKAFLAEKARITKLSISKLDEEELIVRVMPVLQTLRSAKAIMTIMAGPELMYSYEIDYSIFTVPDFQNVFQQFYRENEYKTISHQTYLPPVAVKLTGKSQFSISLGPYRAAHCRGHFSQFPIVSAVFIMDNLIEGIRQWFRIHQMEGATFTMDQLESFLIKAMPIDTEFRAEVKVKNVSSKAIMFAVSVLDHQNMEYGNYFLTFEKSKN